MQSSRIVANDPDFICQPCLDKTDHDTWHDLPFTSVYEELKELFENVTDTEKATSLSQRTEKLSVVEDCMLFT